MIERNFSENAFSQVLFAMASATYIFSPFFSPNNSARPLVLLSYCTGTNPLPGPSFLILHPSYRPIQRIFLITHLL